MSVVYEAVFEEEGKGEGLFLRTITPDGAGDRRAVDVEQVRRLEKTCSDFGWNRSAKVSMEVGRELYALLDSEGGGLTDALKRADGSGEALQIVLRGGGPSALPFEVLYDGGFLAPYRAHIVRRVSDYGRDRRPAAEDRALRILFMACSPEGVSPTLDFEKEEESIYAVTEGFAVEIDVEDTGSPEGLGEQLERGFYDVVHISGHADIDEEGRPFFWMEDREGMRAEKELHPA